MLEVYVRQGDRLAKVPASDAIPAEGVWIDMVRPTAEEERLVERSVGIDVPTREDMQEIEASSRLYQENGAVYMTAAVLVRSQAEAASLHPVTFVLTPHQLLTVRYCEPKSFEMFDARCRKPGADHDPPAILAGLLDAVVDRLADTLERLSAELDELSERVFMPAPERRLRAIEYQDVLRDIGRKGELNARIQESLVTIGRLASYLNQALVAGAAGRDLRGRVKTLGRDAASLTEHAHSQSDRVTFLLDATLGMINIEQNAIIKIVSIAALVFLPPTVIASVYGMNFQFMPELAWPWGYPFALALMAASAVLPYLVFRRIGWL